MWDAKMHKKLTHFIISIAVLENTNVGLQKRDTFSTLNVGLAGTGNRTRATCEASSGTNRSAIHYTLEIGLSSNGHFTIVTPAKFGNGNSEFLQSFLKHQCSISNC
jgi:hypothetical protein